MELERPRRRRDALGHKPLCDRIARGVLGKSDTNARGRDVTAHGARVDPEGARRFGERPLQHVAQDERAEVPATQGVPADEITEARGKEPPAVDRLADGGGRLAVELAELHDLDDRRISEQEPRNRPIALGHHDHRDAVLARDLHFDADTERRDAGIGDEHGRARDMRAVDLIHRARIQVRGADGIGDPVGKIRAQAGGLDDLRQELVEQLGARTVVERGQPARDVRLAESDRSLFLWFVHGPLMMLGPSSCPRRIRRMPEQRVAEHLRRLPLFSRLPESELAEIADRVRTKSFKRGEMIFRKDDPGTHLYMVLDGGVKIALPGEFGQEALVAIMRPGEFFGELALFDRSPRSASATALEDTRAALLAGDDFLAYLESHPASFRVVLETLARTIRRLSDRVEDLIFLDVPSRVAKYLLDLVRSSGGDWNELTLTQDELGGFIGASRVSVNRVLGDLERREIISIRRRRIAIKDADRLAKEVRF